MEGNQVPQELVSEIGVTFENILKEVCSLYLSLSLTAAAPHPKKRKKIKDAKKYKKKKKPNGGILLCRHFSQIYFFVSADG